MNRETFEPSCELRFGRFRLQPTQRQLFENDVPIKLGGRAFNVLWALVERRDRAVPKNELMQLAWPKRVVEENNLQVQVVTLRKLLGPATITTSNAAIVTTVVLTGRYFEGLREARADPLAYDGEARRRLWDVCAALTSAPHLAG